MKFKVIFAGVIGIFLGFMIGYSINSQKDKLETKRLLRANRKYQLELRDMESLVNSILAEGAKKPSEYQKQSKIAAETNFTSQNEELRYSQQQFINRSQYIPDKTPVNNPIITKQFQPKLNHFGVDFAGRLWEPIYTAASGVVENVKENDPIYGKCIIVDHLNGYKTFYGHNLKNLVREGYFVKKGNVIGEIGKSGKSSAPHLHFEIRFRDEKIDPINIMK